MRKRRNTEPKFKSFRECFESMKTPVQTPEQLQREFLENVGKRLTEFATHNNIPIDEMNEWVVVKNYHNKKLSGWMESEETKFDGKPLLPSIQIEVIPHKAEFDLAKWYRPHDQWYELHIVSSDPFLYGRVEGITKGVKHLINYTGQFRGWGTQLDDFDELISHVFGNLFAKAKESDFKPYRSLSPYAEQLLATKEFNLWERGKRINLYLADKTRKYLIQDALNIEIEWYNSGNISSVSVDGKFWSNRKGRGLWEQIKSSRIWYDVPNAQWKFRLEGNYLPDYEDEIKTELLTWINRRIDTLFPPTMKNRKNTGAKVTSFRACFDQIKQSKVGKPQKPAKPAKQKDIADQIKVGAKIPYYPFSVGVLEAYDPEKAAKIMKPTFTIKKVWLKPSKEFPNGWASGVFDGMPKDDVRKIGLEFHYDSLKKLKKYKEALAGKPNKTFNFGSKAKSVKPKPTQVIRTWETDVKNIKTYSDFKKLYTETWEKASSYGVGQAGSQIYMERLAQLADLYPDWEEKLENEIQKEKKPAKQKDAYPDWMRKDIGDQIKVGAKVPFHPKGFYWSERLRPQDAAKVMKPIFTIQQIHFQTSKAFPDGWVMGTFDDVPPREKMRTLKDKKVSLKDVYNSLVKNELYKSALAGKDNYEFAFSGKRSDKDTEWFHWAYTLEKARELGTQAYDKEIEAPIHDKEFMEVWKGANEKNRLDLMKEWAKAKAQAASKAAWAAVKDDDDDDFGESDEKTSPLGKFDLGLTKRKREELTPAQRLEEDIFQAKTKAMKEIGISRLGEWASANLYLDQPTYKKLLANIDNQPYFHIYKDNDKRGDYRIFPFLVFPKERTFDSLGGKNYEALGQRFFRALKPQKELRSKNLTNFHHPNIKEVYVATIGREGKIDVNRVKRPQKTKSATSSQPTTTQLKNALLRDARREFGANGASIHGSTTKGYTLVIKFYLAKWKKDYPHVQLPQTGTMEAANIPELKAKYQEFMGKLNEALKVKLPTPTQSPTKKERYWDREIAKVTKQYPKEMKELFKAAQKAKKTLKIYPAQAVQKRFDPEGKKEWALSYDIEDWVTPEVWEKRPKTNPYVSDRRAFEREVKKAMSEKTKKTLHIEDRDRTYHGEDDFRDRMHDIIAVLYYRAAFDEGFPPLPTRGRLYTPDEWRSVAYHGKVKDHFAHIGFEPTSDVLKMISAATKRAIKGRSRMALSRMASVMSGDGSNSNTLQFHFQASTSRDEMLQKLPSIAMKAAKNQWGYLEWKLGISTVGRDKVHAGDFVGLEHDPHRYKRDHINVAAKFKEAYALWMERVFEMMRLFEGNTDWFELRDGNAIQKHVIKHNLYPDDRYGFRQLYLYAAFGYFNFPRVSRFPIGEYSGGLRDWEIAYNGLYKQKLPNIYDKPHKAREKITVLKTQILSGKMKLNRVYKAMEPKYQPMPKWSLAASQELSQINKIEKDLYSKKKSLSEMTDTEFDTYDKKLNDWIEAYVELTGKKTGSGLKKLIEHRKAQRSKTTEKISEKPPTKTSKPTPDQQVAQTILQQMGGSGRITTMIGAKNFVSYPDERDSEYGEGLGGVSFKFPKAGGTNKPNYVKIILDPDDTYTMTFGATRGTTFKVINEVKGVYNDQLIPIFESESGLALKLNNPYGVVPMRRRRNFRDTYSKYPVLGGQRETSRKHAESLYVYPRLKKFPIGDEFHARLALIYVMSPTLSKYRKKVIQAVKQAYPNVAWGRWWNSHKKDHPDLKNWGDYVNGMKSNPRKRRNKQQIVYEIKGKVKHHISVPKKFREDRSGWNIKQVQKGVFRDFYDFGTVKEMTDWIRKNLDSWLYDIRVKKSYMLEAGGARSQSAMQSVDWYWSPEKKRLVRDAMNIPFSRKSNPRRRKNVGSYDPNSGLNSFDYLLPSAQKDVAYQYTLHKSPARIGIQPKGKVLKEPLMLYFGSRGGFKGWGFMQDTPLRKFVEPEKRFAPFRYKKTPQGMKGIQDGSKVVYQGKGQYKLTPSQKIKIFNPRRRR